MRQQNPVERLFRERFFEIALIFFFVLVGFMIVAGAGMIAGIAAITVFAIFALCLTWVRMPHWAKKALTTWPGIAIADIAIWYVGWSALPSSTTARASFVMLHIFLSLGLVVERKRLRGTLFKKRSKAIAGRN